ncbi:MAG: hypothetical protein J6T50_04120, partial [Lachnospiraceae bacterium]|nr:hypothetical protein [Lachnospiraceae bacterium]
IYFNFKYSLAAPDQDSAKLMVHAMEIVKTGHILIPDWRYMTTHEIDSAMLLALPFLALTSNIGLSFAISNIIFIFVVIALILTLFNNLKIRLRYALATCCIILIPYQFGMLEYLNMLFFRGGQYSIKVLIPLLAITILSFPEKKLSRDITLSAIWLFLVFLCSFSSGLFPFVTGILPIVGVYVQRFLNDKKDSSVSGFRTLILSMAVVLSMAGFAIHQINDISASGIDAVVTTATGFWGRIGVNLSYYFSVMNGLPSVDWIFINNSVPDVNVVSVDGIGYVFRFFFALAVLIIAIRYLIRVFRKKPEGDSEQTEPIILYMSAIIAVNMIIHLLSSYNQPRYYLVDVIFMMIEAGIFISSVMGEFKPRIRSFAWVCLIFSLALIWFTSKRTVGTNLVSRNYYASCYEMCDFFRGQNVDNVIFIDSTPVEEICRLLLPEQKFSNYLSTENTFISYDWYKNTGSREYYGDSSIVVSVYYDDLIPVFGEEANEKYTYLGSVGPFKMFRADEFCIPLNDQA